MYGSSRLGSVRTNAEYSTSPIHDQPIFENVASRYVGQKAYELTDHLGNVRATVGDILIDHSGSMDAELLTRTDYYPFGMIMPGRSYALDESHRYGFNGKENDDEVKGAGNQQDYGFRIYDGRIARWLSADPLEKEYPSQSAYSFALNTPINAIDPDGRLVIFVNGLRPVYKARKRGFFTSDENRYWGSFVNQATNRLQDDNVVFADANFGLTSTSPWINNNQLVNPPDGTKFFKRREAGRKEAYSLATRIESGDIEFKAGESIKVFAHSLGYAYAEGMVETLISLGYDVEVLHALQPEAAMFGEKPAGLGSLKQYHGTFDDYVDPVEIMGVDEFKMRYADHSIESLKLFEIPEGEDGYVEPRKDDVDSDKESDSGE